MQTIVLAYTDLDWITTYFYDTVVDHADPSTDDPCKGRETYWTRFGDYVCATCHVTLGWSPNKVREGVFSEDTEAWTKRVESMHHDWFAAQERAAELDVRWPRKPRNGDDYDMDADWLWAGPRDADDCMVVT